VVADRLAAGLRPARELLASWMAPDRPNSITLCSSLAGRRPAREPGSELDIVMEFALYHAHRPTTVADDCSSDFNVNVAGRRYQ